MRRFRGQYTRTDAAGLNSIFFARTMKGNDLIQANTWFRDDYAMITVSLRTQEIVFMEL
jgi:hypothetical protein